MREPCHAGGYNYSDPKREASEKWFKKILQMLLAISANPRSLKPKNPLGSEWVFEKT
jgi:hypothetical protein